MIKICINNNYLFADSRISLLFALRLSGFAAVPHFCYHEDLPISGTCRTCLVEVKGVEKPVASCIQDIEATLVVWTESVFSKKARENVFELLLKSHPLDCPICDQAGECDLQDQTKNFAGIFTRHFFKKRSVVDKKIGFFIKTIMTRCIHCTRCIRFNELSDCQVIGILNRGHFSEIGTYAKMPSDSELSGNIIDLCPVGLLTTKSYTFSNKKYKLHKYYSSKLGGGEENNKTQDLFNDIKIVQEATQTLFGEVHYTMLVFQKITQKLKDIQERRYAVTEEIENALKDLGQGLNINNLENADWALDAGFDILKKIVVDYEHILKLFSNFEQEISYASKGGVNVLPCHTVLCNLRNPCSILNIIQTLDDDDDDDSTPDNFIRKNNKHNTFTSVDVKPVGDENNERSMHNILNDIKTMQISVETIFIGIHNDTVIFQGITQDFKNLRERTYFIEKIWYNAQNDLIKSPHNLEGIKIDLQKALDCSQSIIDDYVTELLRLRLRLSHSDRGITKSGRETASVLSNLSWELHSARHIFDEILQKSYEARYFPYKKKQYKVTLVDLHPVGALTARTYAFQSRPWELKITEAIDFTDGFCSSIYVHYRDLEIYKISPKPNKSLNGNLITNKCRFSYDALTNNRLKKIYTSVSSESYSSLTWFAFINKITSIKQKNMLIFLINEELDIFNCNLLKKLCNKYCGMLKLALFNKKNNNNNIFVLETPNLIKSIEHDNKYFFLLSTNIKVESAILNFKIRQAFKKRIVSIFCFGRFFNSGITAKFTAINIKSFILLCEAKLTNMSTLLLKGLDTLFLVGESFLKRFYNFDTLHFKQMFLSVQFIAINLFVGDEGHNYLNIKNTISSRTQKTYFCINLNDSQITRKYILCKQTPIYWATTHRPCFRFRPQDYLLPLSTLFEGASLFINLEKRVYKTQAVFSPLYESKTLESIVLTMFKDFTPNTNCSNAAYQFLLELSKKNFLLISKKKIKFFNTVQMLKFISLYPIKGCLITHYNQNIFTNNSKILKSYHLQTQVNKSF